MLILVWLLAGDIVSVYRKGHLFDVELTGKGVSLKESAFIIPGPSLVPPVQTPIGKVNDTCLFVCFSVIILRSCLLVYSLCCAGGTGDLLWPALPWDVLGSSKAWGRGPHVSISIYSGNRHRPLGGETLHTVDLMEKNKIKFCFILW